MIKFSFIVPVKEINNYIREAVPKTLCIARDDYEIIVYPDVATSEQWEKTRQIASGPGGPAMKRDLALRDAAGDILVFIDDDAYPEKNYLDVLEKDFDDPAVVGVGGPAITPPHDNFWQKISGAVFLSRWSGGYPERYVPVGKRKFIDDWPSVNLAVRKNAFQAVGGFDSAYWPGEDTKLCLDLVKKAGGKLLYDPELVAYHHRREGLRRHLEQIAGYGIHRGFFAKRFPETSFKFKYFLPSAFVLALVLGALISFFFPFVRLWYILFLALYALALIFSFIDIYRYERQIAIAIATIFYIIPTHIVYGFRFIQGFCFTKELKSRLR